MNNRDRVLVVGATGQLGYEVSRLLCEAGKRVRVIARPDADAGKRARLQELSAEIVAADLKAPESIEGACEDVACVVSTATAIVSRRDGDSIETVDHIGQRTLVSLAAKKGVRHFVFVSFSPNDLDYEFQRAKRAVEADLRASGISFTILQPCAFMQIWLSPIVGFDPGNGRARILGDGTQPVSWISLHDVARFAVAAVEGGKFASLTIPLGGPDALTPLQVVGLCQEAGRQAIAVEHVPEAAIEAMFRNARDPVEQAHAAGMLLTARGQVVSPRVYQELLPGRMSTVRDHISQLLAGTASGK
jgi:uncharacterized protein YbjT (DUF2867 family)